MGPIEVTGIDVGRASKRVPFEEARRGQRVAQAPGEPSPRENPTMRLLHSSVPLALAFAVMSCGPVEVRIDKKNGVKAVNGTLTASFRDSNGTKFACGDTIVGSDASQDYTVTTKVVSGGCDFSFDQSVEVLREADYATIKEFKEAVHYLNRVEVQVQRLDFFDDNGTKFDIGRLKEMRMTVNGQTVLDLDEIGALPRTVTLSGDALNTIKSAVKNRQRCTAHVTAHVLVLDRDTPTGVRCEYESQPTLILSTVEI